MAVDNDMKPNVPQRCLFYHGVSREKAIAGSEKVLIYDDWVKIEGFQPGGSNDDTHICPNKMLPNQHYNFDGINGRGYNCYGVSVETTPPKTITTDSCIISATITIELYYNGIFYPRPQKDDKGGYVKSQRDSSERIYLHELGHQLNTWITFACYLHELVNQLQLEVQKIALEGEQKIVLGKALIFSVEKKTDTKKEAELWLKNLINGCKNDVKNKLKAAISQYHTDYGEAGNPWDGKK
jgi:hypothetical protein